LNRSVTLTQKRKDAKTARQTLFIRCAMAPLRLCYFPNGALPEVLADGHQLNYTVKSREGRHIAVPNSKDADTVSLPVLESVPAVSTKLKAPMTADRKFEEVVKSAQDAAVLVLVY
jgi:hypothetical protein